MKSYQILPMLASLAMAVPQSPVASAGSYILAGCYTQGAFLNQNSPPLGGLNTVENCASACAGTQLMAVTGASCICGSASDPSNPPTTTAKTNCNVVCPGNVNEICGGATFINLYNFRPSVSGMPSSSGNSTVAPFTTKMSVPPVNATTTTSITSSAASITPGISVSATTTASSLSSTDPGQSPSANVTSGPSTTAADFTGSPIDSMNSTASIPTGSTNGTIVRPTFSPNTTVSIPTGSSNATTTTASPTTSPGTTITFTFQLQIIIIGTITISKRQVAPAAQYLLANGQATTNPALAATFSVLGGQLYSTALYATDAGVAFQAFAAGTGGAITTTFTATGALAWNNLVFGNGGAASFCQLASGLVDVVFTGPNPAGCTPVILKVVPLTPSSTVITPFAPTTTTTGTTIINNYVINTNNVVNINTLNVNTQNNFNSNTINYLNVTQNIFLAKFCPSCPVIQVQRDCGCFFQAGVPVAIPVSYVPVCPVCPAGASVRVGAIIPSTTMTIYTTTCVTVGTSTLTSSSPISTVVLAITQAPVSSVVITTNGVLSTVLVPAAVAAASVPVPVVAFSSPATAGPGSSVGTPAPVVGAPAPVVGAPAPVASAPAASVGTAAPAPASTPAAFIGAASTIESTGLLAIVALAGFVLF